MKDFKVLQLGNAKLKNMLVYSHTPIKGCMDCSSCADTCYAVKAYRQYKDTKVAWDRNLNLAKNDTTQLIVRVCNQLKRTKQKVVRIHASGDFVSQQYVDAWTDIISEHPHIKFYTYTKSMDRFDFSKILKLDNFNLIDSILPNGEKNYGSYEWCLEKKEEFGSLICPATIGKTKAERDKVKCGRECHYCVDNKNVVFVQH